MYTSWHMGRKRYTSDVQAVIIDILAYIPWHQRLHGEVNENGVNCLEAGNDSLLHIGVCCKPLPSQVIFKTSNRWAANRWFITSEPQRRK